MAKMIMVLNPECADKAFVGNLQNAVQICPPPKFEVDRPTLVDLFTDWNIAFHVGEVNPRPYALMFNFAGPNKSISEISHAGNVVKAYVNDDKAENQHFVRMMFDMLEKVDEVNYLL